MRLPDAADWYTGDGREFTLGGRTHTESPSVAPDSPYSSTEQRSAMQRLLDDDLSEFGGGDGPNSMHSFHMEDAIRRVHALSVLGGAGGAGGAGPGGAASAPASYLGGSPNAAAASLGVCVPSLHFSLCHPPPRRARPVASLTHLRAHAALACPQRRRAGGLE